MDGAAAFQIAGNRHVEMFEVLAFLPQCGQVAQGLRRMLMGAVAAVHDRHAGIAGGKLHRAIAGMADDEHVGIIGRDPHRVGEALAFCRGACRRIGAADGFAA